MTQPSSSGLDLAAVLHAAEAFVRANQGHAGDVRAQQLLKDLREALFVFRGHALEPRELAPVEGDELPPIGSTVLIHLASQGAWVEHVVAGYYVWPDLQKQKHQHRVFVRVRSRDGVLNARILEDVRPIDANSAHETVPA